MTKRLLLVGFVLAFSCISFILGRYVKSDSHYYIEDVLIELNYANVNIKAYERTHGMPPQDLSDLVDKKYLPDSYSNKYNLVNSNGLVVMWPTLSEGYASKSSEAERGYKAVLSNSSVIMIGDKIFFNDVDNGLVMVEAGSQDTSGQEGYKVSGTVYSSTSDFFGLP